MAQQPELERPLVEAGSVCLSCGAALNGPYCAACGQRVLPHLTIRSLAREASARFIDIDGDFGRTLWRALVRPEVVIDDWVRGRTAPYTSPFTFLGVAFTLAAWAFVVSGGVGNGGQLMLVTVPIFIAGVGRLVVWRRTYAEHLVANCYLLAWDFLLFAVLMLSSRSIMALVSWRVYRWLPWLVVAWHARGLARFGGRGWQAWAGGAIAATLTFRVLTAVMAVGLFGRGALLRLFHAIFW